MNSKHVLFFIQAHYLKQSIMEEGVKTLTYAVLSHPSNVIPSSPACISFLRI